MAIWRHRNSVAKLHVTSSRNEEGKTSCTVSSPSERYVLSLVTVAVKKVSVVVKYDGLRTKPLPFVLSVSSVLFLYWYSVRLYIPFCNPQNAIEIRCVDITYIACSCMPLSNVQWRI